MNLTGGVNTVLAVPSTPYPATYNPTTATGTYDFIIQFDFPFHSLNALEMSRPGYLVRGAEWKNTLTVEFETGIQAGGSPSPDSSESRRAAAALSLGPRTALALATPQWTSTLCLSSWARIWLRKSRRE